MAGDLLGYQQFSREVRTPPRTSQSAGISPQAAGPERFIRCASSPLSTSLRSSATSSSTCACGTRHRNNNATPPVTRPGRPAPPFRSPITPSPTSPEHRQAPRSCLRGENPSFTTAIANLRCLFVESPSPTTLPTRHTALPSQIELAESAQHGQSSSAARIHFPIPPCKATDSSCANASCGGSNPSLNPPRAAYC